MKLGLDCTAEGVAAEGIDYIAMLLDVGLALPFDVSIIL